MRTLGTLHESWRAAYRLVRHRPSRTAVMVLTLAVSVGLAAESTGLAYTVLFKPLPFPEPERLVTLRSVDQTRIGMQWPASFPAIQDWRAGLRSTTMLSVLRRLSVSVNLDDRMQVLPAAAGSSSVFQLLGVTPLRGRLFEGDDLTPGHATVLVSESAVRTVFGGDPDIVGKSLDVDGTRCIVIGVVPDVDLSMIGSPMVWLPVWLGVRPEREGGELDNRGYRFLHVLGRLAPNVTMQQAQAELDAVASQMAAAEPATNRTTGAAVRPLQAQSDDGRRPPLLALGVAVLLLLTMSVMNLGAMQFGSAVSRRHSRAVETMLGRPSGQLMATVIAEGTTIGLLAGIGAWWIAFWIRESIIRTAPVAFHRLSELPSPAVMLFVTVGTAMAIGIGICLVGTLLASVNPSAELVTHAGRSPASTRRGRRLRQMLLAAEVTVAVTLLIGAGVAVRSYVAASRIDPGFSKLDALSVRLNLPAHFSPPRSNRIVAEILDRLREHPAIESAGATQALPLKHASWDTRFKVVERPEFVRTQPSGYIRVAGEYFATLGLSMRKGRALTSEDDRSAPRVAVVNETFARTFLPGANDVGQHLAIWDNEPPFQIVGVVADTVQEELRQPPRPVIYLPSAQKPRGAMTLVATGAGGSIRTAEVVRQTAMAVEPRLKLGEISSLGGTLDRLLAPGRYAALVLGVVAGLAALIALVGLYAVMAQMVSTTVPELGLRLALGAQPNALSRMVIGQCCGSAAVGVVLGTALAYSLAVLVRSVAPGVPDISWPAVLAAGAMMLSLAMAAALLPARRAARVEPLRALAGD